VAAARALTFEAGPRNAVQSISRVPGDGVPFKDCLGAQLCPELVVVPSSTAGFKLGSPPDEPHHLPSEAQHEVAIKAFAVGKYEVSTGEYLACVKAKACRHPEWLEPDGEHNIETGRGVTYKSLGPSISGDDQPIVGISWDDALAYTKWLSEVTGHSYRLLSEAEWEYAARAGTTSAYWWGNEPKSNGVVMACCRGCGSDHDGKGFFPVKSFAPNAWGLHNVHGNVWEWVADYYCESYAFGPSDGGPRADKTCLQQDKPEGLRVFRGGSCFYEPMQMRAAMRLRNWPSFRNQTIGFRIARDLAQK
jgi:formylglycine-generating enzyme required for sulfatase activity